MKSTIAIDLGGTKIEYILSHDKLKTIEVRERVACEQFKGYEHLVDQITGIINNLLAKCPNGAVVGIGVPGANNPMTGLIRNSNIQTILNRPLKQDIETVVGQSISMDNDGLCFTLSEAIFGAGKDYNNVLGVILGTGVGGGLVIDKKPYSGRSGIACEVGHMTINFEGITCWCGRKGCFEAYTSGTATQQYYTSLTGESKKLAEIFTSAEQNVEPDLSIIQRLYAMLGQGIANLIMNLDPDVIVIGGGISNQPSLLTELKKHTSNYLFNKTLETPIVLNQRGDSSGVFGAALLAQTNL